MELVSCSDYVISMGKTSKCEMSDDECFNRMFKYANFLKRPLELGMFIPCDKDGNVLEKPGNYDEIIKMCKNGIRVITEANFNQYQEAKERVLFEGFKLTEKNIYYILVQDFNNEIMFHLNGKPISNYKTIEDLTSLGLTLTDNAVKQLV